MSIQFPQACNGIVSFQLSFRPGSLKTHICESDVMTFCRSKMSHRINGPVDSPLAAIEMVIEFAKGKYPFLPTGMIPRPRDQRASIRNPPM